MQERNVLGSFTAFAVTPFIEFIEALTPFLIIAILLIIADSRFGIQAAKKRGEQIRTSRKWRRAINKCVDYICWIMLAGIFGATYSEILGIPSLSAFMLLIIYGIEITSCINNYLEYKGVAFRLSFANILNSIINRIKDKKQ